MSVPQPKLSFHEGTRGPHAFPVSNSNQCQRPKRKNNMCTTKAIERGQGPSYISAPLWSHMSLLPLKAKHLLRGLQVSTCFYPCWPLLPRPLPSPVPHSAPVSKTISLILDRPKRIPGTGSVVIVPSARNVLSLDICMADSFLCSSPKAVINFLFSALSFFSVSSYFIYSTYHYLKRIYSFVFFILSIFPIRMWASWEQAPSTFGSLL